MRYPIRQSIITAPKLTCGGGVDYPKFSLAIQKGSAFMTSIKDIMQVGVGVPDREKSATFARDMLGLPTTDSPNCFTRFSADASLTVSLRLIHDVAAGTAREFSDNGPGQIVA
jgi:hypothetical protein